MKQIRFMKKCVVAVFVLAFALTPVFAPRGAARQRAETKALASKAAYFVNIRPVLGAKSTIYLKNVSVESKDIQLVSRDKSGQPVDTSLRRVAGGEVASIDLSSLPLTTVSLAFSPANGVVGFELIESLDGSRGEAMPAIEARSNQLVFPEMIPSDAFFKKVFILNASPGAGTAKLIISDRAGVEIARADLPALASNGSIDFSLKDLFREQVLKEAKLVRVVSNTELVGFQLVDSSDEDISAMPALVNPSGTWKMPIGTTVNGFELSTEVRIFNPNNSMATAEVEANRGDSSESIITPVTVMPNSTVSLLTPRGIKYVGVKATSPVFAFEIFGVLGGKGMAASVGQSADEGCGEPLFSASLAGGALTVTDVDLGLVRGLGGKIQTSSAQVQSAATATATSTYTITGRIVKSDNSNNGVGNVLVDTSNRSGNVSTRTDSNGYFTLTLSSTVTNVGSCGGSSTNFVITPVTSGANGYSFSPSYRAVTGSQSNVNFTATAKPNATRPSNQPDFRLPLPLGDVHTPGGYDWMVTTEAGGYYSNGVSAGSDSCHTDLGSGFYALDLVGPSGTPILAAADGDIATWGYDAGGWGNFVVIQHPNGFYTRYTHFQTAPFVTTGHVMRGQVLGLMGSTGLSTGTHIHFQIYYNGYATANSQSTTAQLKGIQVQFTPVVNYVAAGKNKSTNPGPLTLVSANGGENWPVGSMQTIRWSYIGNSTSVGDSVRVELLKDGSVNSVIASSAAIGSNGVGSLNWTVPSLPTGSDYRIRVISTLRDFLSDSSDGNFTITAAGQSRAVVSTSARLSQSSAPFYVGKTLNGTFTIVNRGNANLVMSRILLGGRLNGTCPNNVCPDFSAYSNITLGPGQSYNYSGSFTPQLSGNYSFFAAYQRPDGTWNTSLDVENGAAAGIGITVQNAAPTLTGKSPTTIYASSRNQTIYLNGTGLTNTSYGYVQFPNGGTAFIYPPAQIVSRSYGQIGCYVTLGARGTYYFWAYTSDGGWSNALPITVY